MIYVKSDLRYFKFVHNIAPNFWLAHNMTLNVSSNLRFIHNMLNVSSNLRFIHNMAPN